jgi:hypothetical protein
MAINSGERRDELQVDDETRGQQWWTETVDGRKPAPAVVGEAATCTLDEATASKRCANEWPKVLDDMATSAWRWTIKTRDENTNE